MNAKIERNGEVENTINAHLRVKIAGGMTPIDAGILGLVGIAQYKGEGLMSATVKTGGDRIAMIVIATSPIGVKSLRQYVALADADDQAVDALTPDGVGTNLDGDGEPLPKGDGQ